MTGNNLCQQSARVAANVIPLPGKLARYRRSVKNKTGLRSLNQALRQALCLVKDQVLHPKRRSRRVRTGGGPSTQAQGYPIRRAAA
jgi:hypothetical protein